MTADLPFARHAVRDLVAHRRKVYCLDWSCNGKKLATGSNDQSVRVWSVDSKHRVGLVTPRLIQASTAQQHRGTSLQLSVRLCSPGLSRTKGRSPRMSTSTRSAWYPCCGTPPARTCSPLPRLRRACGGGGPFLNLQQLRTRQIIMLR